MGIENLEVTSNSCVRKIPLTAEHERRSGNVSSQQVYVIGGLIVGNPNDKRR
jgi:hypothetical protein